MSSVEREIDLDHCGRGVIGKETKEKGIKYMECLKNHAAAIGGDARDGCGEFLAGGEEGTIEALKCSACNCHRNFHRKILLYPQPISAVPPKLVGATTPQLINDYQYFSTPSEPLEEVSYKKRFRTRFTQDQKEKMLEFAEKSHWKIHKLGESEVKNFCQEIGVKRKVLKVWMHNNKYHNLAAKKTTMDIPPQAQGLAPAPVLTPIPSPASSPAIDQNGNN